MSKRKKALRKAVVAAIRDAADWADKHLAPEDNPFSDAYVSRPFGVRQSPWRPEYDWEAQGKTARSVPGYGAPGRGKSAMVAKVAKRLGKVKVKKMKLAEGPWVTPRSWDAIDAAWVASNIKAATVHKAKKAKKRKPAYKVGKDPQGWA
jgi:hypothetical protein